MPAAQRPPADPRLWQAWSNQTYGPGAAIDIPQMGAARPNTEQFGDGFSGSGSSGGVSGSGGGMRGAFESSIMNTINHPGLSEHDVEGKINAGTEGIALGEQNALLNTQNKAGSMDIGGGAVSAANRDTLSDYAGQRADFAKDTRITAANDAAQQKLGALNAGANYYGHLDDNARSDRDALVNYLSHQQQQSSSNPQQFSNLMTDDGTGGFGRAPMGNKRGGGVAGPAENGPVMMQKAFGSNPYNGQDRADGGGGEGGGQGEGGSGRAQMPIDDSLSDDDQRREDLIQRQSDARFPMNPFGSNPQQGGPTNQPPVWFR